MTPIAFVITNVLDLSYADVARMAGVTRNAVSCWARGVRRPPLDQLRSILAAEAARRSLPWEDSWLFKLPACPDCPNLPGTVCPGGCARLVARCAAIRAGGCDGEHGAGVGADAGAVTGNGGAAVPVTSDRQEAA